MRASKNVKVDDQRPAVQGEGNYEAAKRHRKATEAFVDSGQVDSAAKAAAPKSAKEARDLKEAEKIGRARAKS